MSCLRFVRDEEIGASGLRRLEAPGLFGRNGKPIKGGIIDPALYGGDGKRAAYVELPFYVSPHPREVALLLNIAERDARDIADGRAFVLNEDALIPLDMLSGRNREISLERGFLPKGSVISTADRLSEIEGYLRRQELDKSGKTGRHFSIAGDNMPLSTGAHALRDMLKGVDVSSLSSEEAKNLYGFLKGSNAKPEDLIQRCIVVPPLYMRENPGSAISDINDAIRNLVIQSAYPSTEEAAQNAFNEYRKALDKAMGGKNGKANTIANLEFSRSERSTVVPDPRLKIGEIGISVEIGKRILRKELIDYMREKRIALTDDEAKAILGNDSDKAIGEAVFYWRSALTKEPLPDFAFGYFSDIEKRMGIADFSLTRLLGKTDEDSVRALLEAVENDRRLLLLEGGLFLRDILNDMVYDRNIRLGFIRQPVQHQGNFLSFDPIFNTTDGDEALISFSPIACESFNLDFDGDKGFVIAFDENEVSRKILEKIYIVNNLANPNTGKIQYAPSNEMLTGLLSITSATEDKRGLPPVREDDLVSSNIPTRTLIDVIFKSGTPILGENGIVVSDGVTPIATTKGIYDLNSRRPSLMPYINMPFTSSNVRRISEYALSLRGNALLKEVLDFYQEEGFKAATSIVKRLDGFLGLRLNEREDFELKKMLEAALRMGRRDPDKGDKWIESSVKKLIDNTLGKKSSDSLEVREWIGLITQKRDDEEAHKRLWPIYDQSAFGVAENIIQREVGISGANAKTMFSALDGMHISEEDCKTSDGLWYPIGEKESLLGRELTADLLLSDGSTIGKGVALDMPLLRLIEADGVKSLKVRSPLTCHAKDGICSCCAGRMHQDIRLDSSDMRRYPIGYRIGAEVAHAFTKDSADVGKNWSGYEKAEDESEIDRDSLVVSFRGVAEEGRVLSRSILRLKEEETGALYEKVLPRGAEISFEPKEGTRISKGRIYSYDKERDCSFFSQSGTIIGADFPVETYVDFRGRVKKRVPDNVLNGSIKIKTDEGKTADSPVRAGEILNFKINQRVKRGEVSGYALLDIDKDIVKPHRTGLYPMSSLMSAFPSSNEKAALLPDEEKRLRAEKRLPVGGQFTSLSRVDGRVESIEYLEGLRQKALVGVRDDSGRVEYHLTLTSGSPYLPVSVGDYVRKGDALSSIEPSGSEYMRLMGRDKTALWLLDRVRRVLREADVNLDDRNIELMIKPMLDYERVLRTKNPELRKCGIYHRSEIDKNTVSEPVMLSFKELESPDAISSLLTGDTKNILKKAYSPTIGGKKKQGAVWRREIVGL